MRTLFSVLSLGLLVTGSAGSVAFGALRGDWQSAGAPMQPYFPAYKYQYLCQAELTDDEERVGDGDLVPAGRPYRLYGVYKFEVSGKKTYSNFDGQWQWVAKLLDAQDRESMYLDLKRAPKSAFSTEGHGAGIHFRRGESAASDLVTLSAYVKLPINEYYLSQSHHETVTRHEGSVEVRVSAYLTRENGQPESLPRSKERQLYVVCDKKK